MLKNYTVKINNLEQTDTRTLDGFIWLRKRTSCRFVWTETL